VVATHQLDDMSATTYLIRDNGFAAMQMKEVERYRCEDYISLMNENANAPRRSVSEEDLRSEGHASTSDAPAYVAPMNAYWRESICIWAFDIADRCDLSREVVSVCMSYLDRFLSVAQQNRTISLDKPTLQLISATSMYLAAKLYEPRSKRLSVTSFVRVSQGLFTNEDMEEMERKMLSGLSWYMHPPTALTYIRQILVAVSSKSNQQQRSGSMEGALAFFELARFLTELSVCDYFFVTIRPSTVALASIMIAAQEVPVSNGAFGALVVLTAREVLDYQVGDLARALTRLRTGYYHTIGRDPGNCGTSDSKHQQHNGASSNNEHNSCSPHSTTSSRHVSDSEDDMTVM